MNSRRFPGRQGANLVPNRIGILRSALCVSAALRHPAFACSHSPALGHGQPLAPPNGNGTGVQPVQELLQLSKEGKPAMAAARRALSISPA